MHDTSITTVEETDPEKPHMFILTCEKEELLFAAENDAELEEWIMVLKDEIEAIENSPSMWFCISKILLCEMLIARVFALGHSVDE